MTTYALIPAAGKSTRMGRPKLALPLRGRTILELVVETIRRAGVEHVLVVVGPHVPELKPLAERARAQVLLLAEETSDMRATIERGLAWLEERFHPRPEDHWLLVPADHPTLHEAVIPRLVAAREESPSRSIVVPTFQGKRGHPVLIDWAHVARLRAFPVGAGVNAYLRERASETVEVPVNTATVLCDLDEPRDYEKLMAESGE
jgi:molybdenum cofactor cytidylyltransferase